MQVKAKLNVEHVTVTLFLNEARTLLQELNENDDLPVASERLRDTLNEALEKADEAIEASS